MNSTSSYLKAQARCPLQRNFLPKDTSKENVSFRVSICGFCSISSEFRVSTCVLQFRQIYEKKSYFYDEFVLIDFVLCVLTSWIDSYPIDQPWTSTMLTTLLPTEET